MASNVFPMLSSSPPPIDDCPDDDEDDDEFGNFTSANIPFDSSFDSPVTVDKFKSFKSGDNGVNDANFTDEIHKFNSFSNSATPSPQDFVPNFSDEKEEHCKNGFKPIKREKCKISLNDVDRISNEDNASFEVEVTSHKPVPVKAAVELNSSSDSKLLTSEDCDKLKNTEDLVENHLENKTVQFNENNSFEEDSSVCDLSEGKVTKELNSVCENDNNADIACVESKTYASKAASDVDFSKFNKDVDKISIKEENSLPEEKFACDFNFENTKDIQDEGGSDYQEAENLSSILKQAENFPSEFEQSEKFQCDLQQSEQFPCDFQQSEQFACDFQQAENFPCEFPKTEKFDSDFQRSEHFPCDFQEAENFSSNQTFSSSPKSVDDNISGAPDKESDPKEVSLSHSENLPVVENPDEFDDFQGCEEQTTITGAVENEGKSSDDFEFDDFQDFQGPAVPNQESDEFADFQDFSAAEVASMDDFADFSAAPFGSNNKAESSDQSEFADFEEASFNASSESSFQATSSSHKSNDTLSTVINAIFPLSDSPNDSENSEEISPQILEQTNKSRRLWEKLHEVEQTPGMRFQWGVSHSFQQLLRSVNVDYHSILRTSSVPIFASGLSLLEPVKGLSSSASNESEDRNLTPKDPIPPVEFDWNSSGLVNPLDSVQAASTLMDLSFLSSVETHSNRTSNDHSFENELLKPSPALACADNTSKTLILEQLLSKNISSLPDSKVTHRPSDLSDEAVRVLDQLPDLSFMQAKVLMFPISSKT